MLYSTISEFEVLWMRFSTGLRNTSEFEKIIGILLTQNKWSRINRDLHIY